MNGSQRKICRQIIETMTSSYGAPKATVQGFSGGLNEIAVSNSIGVVAAYPDKVVCGLKPLKFIPGSKVVVEAFALSDLLDVLQIEGTRPMSYVEERNSQSGLLRALGATGDQSTVSMRLATRRGDFDLMVEKGEQRGNMRGVSLAIVEMIEA